MVVYSFYDIDSRVRRYAEALASRGDSVDVIALRREGTPASEVMRGVPVHHWGMVFSCFAFAMIVPIIYLLRR